MLFEGVKQRFREVEKQERLAMLVDYIETLWANPRGIEELKELFVMERNLTFHREKDSGYYYELTAVNEKLDLLKEEIAKSRIPMRFRDLKGDFLDAINKEKG